MNKDIRKLLIDILHALNLGSENVYQDFEMSDEKYNEIISEIGGVIDRINEELAKDEEDEYKNKK